MDAKQQFIVEQRGGDIVGDYVVPFVTRTAVHSIINGVKNLIVLGKVNSELPPAMRSAYTRRYLRAMVSPQQLLYVPMEQAVINKVQEKLLVGERNVKNNIARRRMQ
jgi:hypothetical protein